MSTASILRKSIYTRTKLTTHFPLSSRTFTTSPLVLEKKPSSPSSPPPWASQPGPPRLPKEEQEIFDKLQKSSTGAFSTMKSDAPPDIKIDEPSDVMEQHPNMRRGEKPLFEGERNPQTGEVGGPKTNPLKYGDYAYNGRVTGKFFPSSSPLPSILSLPLLILSLLFLALWVYRDALP